MKPNRIIALLVAAVAIVALVIVMSGRESGHGTGRSDQAPVEEVKTTPQVAKATNAVNKAQVETPLADASTNFSDAPTSIQLRARLIGHDAAQTSIAGALIGPAHISPEDLGEWRDWLAAGSVGAGAKNMLELANVREWMKAPVSIDGSSFVLGPTEVPAAAVYKILAWHDDHSYYWKEVPAPVSYASIEIDAGNISSTRPTGLSISFQNNVTGEDQLLATVHRNVRESASWLFPIVENISPMMADALADAQPLLLNTNGENRVTPLLPDYGVTITLSTAAGTEGKPVGVELIEGQVRPVKLDLADIFKGLTTNTTQLRGILLQGETSKPLSGAQIYRRGAPARLLQQVTPAGGFVFDGIPLDKPSRFTVEYLPPETTRPLAPAMQDYTFTPDPDTSGPQSVVWRMPVYKWVVLELSAEEQAFIKTNAPRPFPIYVLQKRNGGGWEDTRADRFIKLDAEVAVSVTEPGEYRIVAATSPFFTAHSGPVVVDEQAIESRTRLVTSLESKQTYQVKMISSENGLPVTRGRLVLAGPHRSIPPMRRHPDENGIVTVGPVNAGEIYVTYETPLPQPREHKLATKDAVNGTWEIRL